MRVAALMGTQQDHNPVRIFHPDIHLADGQKGQPNAILTLLAREILFSLSMNRFAFSNPRKWSAGAVERGRGRIEFSIF